jgi:hypothetical protein
MTRLYALLLATLTACAADPSDADPPRFDIAEAEAAIFASADSWTLFATKPLRLDEAHMPEANFHGYEILGQAELSDPIQRAELVKSLNGGIRANDDMVAGCFNPRHAVRAETADGRADLLICFECLQIYVFGAADSTNETVLTSKIPRAVFDRIFEGAGLEIAD